MKLSGVIFYSIASAAHAFVGPIFPSQETKAPALSAVSRRSMLCTTSGFLLGTLFAPNPSHSRGTANPFFDDEVNFEPSQMARPDKIDINGAFVVSTKFFCFKA